jgi:uncharacterized protein YbgA (DUF1722 family)/uncharacterized protein YbbK (DUF523 family)
MPDTGEFCAPLAKGVETDGSPLKLGVSSCLLGHNVRYDGGHQLDRYITHTLGAFVDFVPVCPEVECGMPIPREAMRLVGDPENPRLVTRKSGEDKTDQMRSWAEKRLDELEAEGLSGFIFKARSPSSGMGRVKVYQEGGKVLYGGVGLFAGMFMERFPLLPVEDDGRLNDAGIRENFIERLFAFRRLQEAAVLCSAQDIVDFHTRHKLLLMAHDPEAYRGLGKLTAEAGRRDPDELFREYTGEFLRAMAKRATPAKHGNVLMHAMGYFKRDLSADEKQELLEVIHNYRKGLLPLIVPVTLINHFVRKYHKEYLAGQYYLKPHPVELKLRNHV